ncbi:MAG: exodeoxyribonuclease V subunit alpha [Victivallaceae bacterium]|nr:exodeoxyribonuclease V subunit alpha [Victivallaceae bacterium]
MNTNKHKVKLLRQIFGEGLIDERFNVINGEQLNLTVNDFLVARDIMRLADSIENRLLLILLLLLADRVNNGSTCLIFNSTFDRQAEILATTTAELFTLAGNLPNKLTTPNSPLVLSDNRLYFQRYYCNEQRLSDNLQLLSTRSATNIPDPIKIKQQLQAIITTNKYAFDPLQIQAVITALLNSFAIIAGGPGTGKTTIIVAILRCLLRLGCETTDISLAAPTGRAAKRMTEAVSKGINEDLTSQTADDLKVLELEAVTIHRLLGSNPSKPRFRYNEDNPLPCKIVIIDEASMVDITMMAKLMQAIPDNCKLLLLGDQYQLPPVGVGSVLADLMPDSADKSGFTPKFKYLAEHCLPQVEPKFTSASRKKIIHNLAIKLNSSLMVNRVTVLDKSQRCQQEINNFATYVKQGGKITSSELPPTWQEFMADRKINPVVDNANELPWQWYSAEGVFSLPAPRNQPTHWQQIYLAWIKEHFCLPKNSSGQQEQSYITLLRSIYRLKAPVDFANPDKSAASLDQLFNYVNFSRILCLVRNGPYGVNSVNRQISSFLKKQLKDDLRNNQEQDFHGAVIMIRHNDKFLDLYNGDIGILLRDITSGRLYAIFQQGKNYIAFPTHLLPEYELAFAMTIHKSQGSEFDRVLMVLPDKPEHRLLTREILYTGLTRAKKAAFIYADDSILDTCIKRKNIRYSGLNVYNDQQ